MRYRNSSLPLTYKFCKTPGAFYLYQSVNSSCYLFAWTAHECEKDDQECIDALEQVGENEEHLAAKGHEENH